MKLLLFMAIMAIPHIVSNQIETGYASYYADKFEGRPTASGALYKHKKMTAAHRKLAFGTRVRVTNQANKRSVEVVINDRGPFVKGRIIDLSRSAAEKLDFIDEGIAKVTVEIVSSKP